MSGPSLRPWLRAPLTLQVVSLLIGALVMAQAVTALLVVALPQPHPEPVRLGELAAAVRDPVGAPVIKRHALIASREPRPPEIGFTDGLAEAALADLMHRPRGSVRVQLERPTRFGRMWRAAAEGFGPPRHGPGPPPYPLPGKRMGPHAGAHRGGPQDRWPGGPPDPFDLGGPGGPGQAGPDLGAIPLFEHFVALVQQPDGRWLVLRPGAERFPNPWQRRVIASSLVTLALVILLGYLFGRRITAPLRAFARAAERFGSDPAAPPMRLNGPAEIGVAAQAFNEMQARIRRFVGDRTAMVGAISHDLRTPLARIRFKIEKAPPELRATVEQDVRQMEEMINSVLAFIRDGQAHHVRERLDLASIVECVVDDMAARGAPVDLQVSASPRVLGDPIALQRVVSNLVENAVKYGTRAAVHVGVQGASAVMRVDDRGPGLPDDELERVFEPFYRSDPARNLDGGGIGLGLAVARSIAREHGGEVMLLTRPDGLTATLSLPLATTG